MEIKFDFGGFADVYQTLELNEGVSEKEVLEGLNTGDIVTTLTVGGDVYNLVAGEIVGKVEGCYVDHDIPYTDFELVEEE